MDFVRGIGLGLSSAARSVWAKSLNGNGEWLPLWQHMDDAAAVAGGLFDDWLSPSVRQLIADPFGGDLLAARIAVTFLAGVHDVGKATPAFAVQDEVLSLRMRELGLEMPPTKDALIDRARVPHALAGHHLLRRWLLDHGWPVRTVSAWAVVVGGHHGVPPDGLSVAEGKPVDYPDLYGAGQWATARSEFLDRMAERTGMVRHLSDWAEVRLTVFFQVVVSGLVIMADWIASDESLLPFYRDRLPVVAGDGERACGALERLELPTAWHPSVLPDTITDLFATRFDLPPGASPRPVQQAAYEVAAEMAGPGLMIVEAPMGEGKTEAALAAAEAMAYRWGCGGIMVALPTQATSDAMFARVVDWLDAMGSTDEPVGAVMLSHGKAKLNRLFQGMVRAGRLAEIGRDEDDDTLDECGHGVVAHSWLSGRKKSQLANFVVGTIDQLLFAALKSRHLVLRHLALAGKVIIIDEVHAYDAFMNSYLTRVLTWLGAYRVPVVALSATLPQERRHVLLEAYRRGIALSRGEPPAQTELMDAAETSYPLITWTEGNDVHSRDVAPSARRTIVSINALDGGAEDDLVPLVAALQDLLSDGGCAVVIRNTVSRVLRTATGLRQAFPGEVSVAHSRFITADRLRKDGELLDRFGPPQRGTERPRRHIVVASQVIEQSLDVDFDVLCTDLAPVDLVLQRMGRLHRHNRGTDQQDRPAKLRQAKIFVTGADFRYEPPTLERGAADFVYHRYPMLRSAAVLQPRFGHTIALPDDIASLVGDAYGMKSVGPETWQVAIDEQRTRWLDSITRRVAEATKFQISDPSPAGDAILGWVSGSVGETEDDAQGQGQVRDGTRSLEIILVQRDRSGTWRTPAWLPEGHRGLFVPTDHRPSDAVAAVLLECSLRLPVGLSSAVVEDILRAETPGAWQQSKLIYRLPVVVIDEDGLGQIGDQAIRYTPELGLETLEVAQ